MGERTVWKFELQGSSTRLQMDPDAEILVAGIQASDFGSGLMMWALVDGNAETVERHFIVVGTGGLIEGPADYIASTELHSGIMLHIFERLASADPIAEAIADA